MMDTMARTYTLLRYDLVVKILRYMLTMANFGEKEFGPGYDLGRGSELECGQMVF